MSMKIEILREWENKPLGRKEIRFKIMHIGNTTPSRTDVQAKLAAQYNTNPELIIVKSVKSSFGVGITEGAARIYREESLVKRIENEFLIKRHEQKIVEGK